MTADPRAYPLAWPDGWPRTKIREAGAYKTSLAGALTNLRNEVRRLCGARSADMLVLSSNVTLGSERPVDPGVVAFFVWESDPIAMPCDRWATVAANVQAIALTIEAMRAMERHGAKQMIRAMFRGFIALPAPDDWRTTFPVADSLAEVEARYRELARAAHPDQGGSNEAMARLNAARNAARRHFAL